MMRHSNGESSVPGARGERRFLIALAASALAGVLLSLLLTQTTPFKAFEAFAADLRISLFGAVMPERQDIVIIAVDEASLARFPFRSPVNRRFLANVVQELDRRGAKVIALDILLDRPTVPEDDAALAMALGAAEAAVVLVTQPAVSSRPSEACEPDAAALDIVPLAPLFRGIGRPGDGVLCADRFDGVFRYPGADFGQGPRRSLADAVVEAAAPEEADALLARRLGPVRLAVGPRGGWPFPTYSANLVGNLPEDWVRGRIVLVGVVTPWDDLHSTSLRYARLSSPVAPAALMPEDLLPGVVVHAYLVAQRLDGARAPRISIWREIVLALLAVSLALAAAVAPYPPWAKTTALAGALVGFWLFALFVFAATGVLLGLSTFSVALIASAGIAMTANEQFERTQKRYIRDAFEHYLAPEVVQELVRNPAQLTLAAAEREISVLFADIEAFTRFTDSHEPAQVTRFVNAYFHRLIGVIKEHGGTVDKIMGDSINAFFSMPVALDDHRDRAVRCAIALDRAARAVTAEFAQAGGAPGMTRVGVHAGKALVGNFGGGARWEYTALGSTVNLAARLENANKTFGTTVCVSAAAKADAPGLIYRTIGPVRLRGITEPIHVFEPFDEAACDLDNIARYEAALAIAAEDEDAAARALAALLDETNDPLVVFQLKRLEAGLLGKVIEP
jgi:class 3 adenylate cyclase/CHASE2 domain-containing sensor protein